MTHGHSSYALIVDDHPLSLKGLKHFLEELAIVSRVVTAEGLTGIDRALVEFGRPRVALIDFWLADGPATSAIRYLQQASPTTRLLVVSGDDRPVVLNRVKALAVHGFISKKDSPRDYRNAVLAVLAGRHWFEGASVVPTAPAPAAMAPRPPAAPPAPPPPPKPGEGSELTPRQAEVLALLLQGRPNKLIAQLLSLSEYTVKEHVTSILRKLNASNRIELIMRLHAERRAKTVPTRPQEWPTTV